MKAAQRHCPWRLRVNCAASCKTCRLCKEKCIQCCTTLIRMNRTREEEEFIAVRVQDPRVQNEGFWNSYVDFKIFLHTNSKAFTAKTSCVRRRYSEFVWLKRKLQKNSGLVPVPDLPGKTFFFTFSNEDLIERRRRGLQSFLDKVVHMTVCLSDSQLHLFLQTQLPVGHIEDCVHGHTPYTVTDAILTYASSNRGWAQEEEAVIQEKSLHPAVPYESVDSPVPPLPALQDAENAESGDSVAEIQKKDSRMSCIHEVDEGITFLVGETEVVIENAHINEVDVQKVEVHVDNSHGLMDAKASVEEKSCDDEKVLQADVRKTNSFVLMGTEAAFEEMQINEEDVLKVEVHEPDLREITEAETSVKDNHIDQQDVVEVVTIEAGQEDTCDEHAFKDNVKCINISVSGVMKSSLHEHSVSGEPVLDASAHKNNSGSYSRPDLQDSDISLLKVASAQGKESAVEEENVREEDAQETSGEAIELTVDTILRKGANEDQGHTRDPQLDGQDGEVCEASATDDVNEGAHEVSTHATAECAMRRPVDSREKHDIDDVNNHVISNCGLERKVDCKKEKTSEVCKVEVHVTDACAAEKRETPFEENKSSEEVCKKNVCVTDFSATGETADSIQDGDYNQKDDGMEATSKRSSNLGHELISDSRSNNEDIDPIITLSDSHKVVSNDNVHGMHAHCRNTGTTDTCINEQDCIVWRDGSNIQKASYDTKDDQADVKSIITSVIEACEDRKEGANIAGILINNKLESTETSVLEGIQDTDSNSDNGHCAKNFAFDVTETVVHEVDDCKTETLNQQPEAHVTDNHTDFTGQLENSR
ncbi:hypothetical protein GJAV_G00152280 [Gymnothorax javanicus]|nr:hypothetical protein GJAV_G00152280 [Gymnothorax javanicus]